MLKIIDGIRYDTAKALRIGAAETGKPGDIRHRRETLYRGKRSQRFFLHGIGGPLSEYGKTTPDNLRKPGEGIRPISPEHARTWCELYLEGTDWAEYFTASAIQDA